MLAPCERCGRHVREAACPFCGASSNAAPRVVSRRVARSALFAFTAGATLVACGNGHVEVYGAPPMELPSPDAAALPPGTDAGLSAVDAAPDPVASTSASTPPIAPPPRHRVIALYGKPPNPASGPVAPAPMPLPAPVYGGPPP